MNSVGQLPGAVSDDARWVIARSSLDPGTVFSAHLMFDEDARAQPCFGGWFAPFPGDAHGEKSNGNASQAADKILSGRPGKDRPVIGLSKKPEPRPGCPISGCSAAYRQNPDRRMASTMPVS